MMDIGKDLKEAYEQGYKDRDAELVRCKDCDRKLGSTECPCCTKEYHINEETFHCAWGERREP